MIKAPFYIEFSYFLVHIIIISNVKTIVKIQVSLLIEISAEQISASDILQINSNINYR